ncbi:hypothetical protein Glove_168g249 [Diversispora epigaea]|uniref:Uncharacterized protein n=1 Tax=Diversispora epigaea TaxID=1348612 RepID=A0A397IT36_9GLOM|nr:hypothetical protein Glove_168g249 [Diversispora epigaea]
MVTKYFFILITFLTLQIVTVIVSANSATVLIPAGKTWWAWSDELSNIHAINLTSANDLNSLNDTCGSALNIPLSDSGSFSLAFKIYMWKFVNKTTPLLNPESFVLGSTTMNSTCNLPCESSAISYTSYTGIDYYYVVAIKNFNTGSRKINFEVSWHIDCDPSNSNNSNSSNIPSSTPTSSSSASSSISSNTPSSSNSIKFSSSSLYNFCVITLVILITLAVLL